DPARRPAPRGTDRGPPARVRGVRGDDPRGALRCRRGPHLRRWHLRADRVDRYEGELSPPRTAVPGPRVSPGEDQDRLAGASRQPSGGTADRRAAVVSADAGRGRARAFRRPEVAVL